MAKKFAVAQCATAVPITVSRRMDPPNDAALELS